VFSALSLVIDNINCTDFEKTKWRFFKNVKSRIIIQHPAILLVGFVITKLLEAGYCIE
jgi:hypothetical protein